MTIRTSKVIEAGRHRYAGIERTVVTVAKAACAIALLCCFASPGHSEQREPITESTGDCGWIGVRVRPMTAAFAASLGMAEPYGAIFEQPEPASPAGKAGIEEGDVITAINGKALSRSSDFDPAISAIPPGSLIYLTIHRNGRLMKPTVMLGSSACLPSEGGSKV